MSLTDQELRRDRWRRALAGQHLDSVDHPDFAQGGLSSRLDQATFRAVLLPEDPEAFAIDFDDDFWKWLEAHTSIDIGDYPFQFGAQTGASAHAAVIFDLWGKNEKWRHYVAVHSSGTIEVSLGERARWVHRRDERELAFYNLTSMVAGVWALLELGAAVFDQFSISGPSLLVQACSDTSGTYLANFGEGWREPTEWGSNDESCVDTGLLWTAELEGLGDAEARQAVAFQMGDRLENGWGTKHRRYLAHRGDFEGKLDFGRVHSG